MADGLFSGSKKNTETAKKEDKLNITKQSTRTMIPVVDITRQVDFGNLPNEKERLQDIVEGIDFESGGVNQYGKDKRKAKNLDEETMKGRTRTLKQIPVCAGGPYLCDSDSDVTVPITAVEELETVEVEEE
jgi:hypothetical protein